jgi:hypothetical protein
MLFMTLPGSTDALNYKVTLNYNAEGAPQPAVSSFGTPAADPANPRRQLRGRPALINGGRYSRR